VRSPWSQVFGDDRPGHGRPQVGEIALVEENGFEDPRLLAEDEHETVARRQAPLGIVDEARSDLDHVDVVALDVAVLDVDVAGRIVEHELPDRRHDDLAPGIGGEARLDER
jgi:hypothetical protein